MRTRFQRRWLVIALATMIMATIGIGGASRAIAQSGVSYVGPVTELLRDDQIAIIEPGGEDAVYIAMDSTTRYEGLNNFAEIAVGDTITVEGEFLDIGTFQATVVRKAATRTVEVVRTTHYLDMCTGDDRVCFGPNINSCPPSSLCYGGRFFTPRDETVAESPQRFELSPGNTVAVEQETTTDYSSPPGSYFSPPTCSNTNPNVYPYLMGSRAVYRTNAIWVTSYLVERRADGSLVRYLAILNNGEGNASMTALYHVFKKPDSGASWNCDNFTLDGEAVMEFHTYYSTTWRYLP